MVAVICNVIINLPVGVGKVSAAMLWGLGLQDYRGILYLWVLVVLFGVCLQLPRTVVGFFIGGSAVLSAINYAKITYLQIPLLPSDIEYLGELDMFVKLVHPLLMVMIALILGLLLGLTIYFDVRAKNRARESGTLMTLGIPARISAVVLIFAIAVLSRNFHATHNPLRLAIEASSAGWAHWSQIDNAGINGFVSATLYNMPTTGLLEPEDYSAEVMQGITERYSKKRNQMVEPAASERWNLVFVLSESVGQIDGIPDTVLDEEPMPNLENLKSAHWGGTLLADQYGSGTSNMEFQLLTGSTTGFFAPGVSSAYQSYLADLDEIPSVTRWVKEANYRTIGILPDERERYKRPAVYEAMGFDEFESLDRMRYTGKIEKNEFVSDEQVYRGVLETLRQSKEPVFANVLTMQNHVPIGDWYEDPIGVSGDIDRGTAESIGMWARGLSYSDSALDQFLKSLESLDEPTAVIYYGDHFPGIMSSDFLQKHDPMTFRTTPVLLWSNRDVAEEPRVMERASASTLVPRLYQMLGLKLPPYFEFLIRVEEEVGTVLREGVYTSEGKVVRSEELSKSQRKLLDDYHLIQYDFSVGERYALDELWFDWDPMAEDQDSPN